MVDMFHPKIVISAIRLGCFPCIRFGDCNVRIEAVLTAEQESMNILLEYRALKLV
jgi:hypothetical protein